LNAFMLTSTFTMITPFVPAQWTKGGKASTPASTANPATIDSTVMLRQVVHLHCSGSSAGLQPDGA
jgi:hypothetical protein